MKKCSSRTLLLFSVSAIMMFATGQVQAEDKKEEHPIRGWKLTSELRLWTVENGVAKLSDQVIPQGSTILLTDEAYNPEKPLTKYLDEGLKAQGKPNEISALEGHRFVGPVLIAPKDEKDVAQNIEQIKAIAEMKIYTSDLPVALSDEEAQAIMEKTVALNAAAITNANSVVNDTTTAAPVEQTEDCAAELANEAATAAVAATTTLAEVEATVAVAGSTAEKKILRLRETPQMTQGNDNTLEYLEDGSALKILEKSPNGKWFRVVSAKSGKEGWAGSRHIQVAAELAAKIPTATALPNEQTVHSLAGTKGCLDFDLKKYSKESTVVGELENLQYGSRAEQFKKQFAPLAIALADISSEADGNLRIPPSVILAHFAMMTGWGSSQLFKNKSNLGGERCAPVAQDQQTINTFLAGSPAAFNTDCSGSTDKKGVYAKFSSHMESGLSYVTNLLGSMLDETSGPYYKKLHDLLKGGAAKSGDVIDAIASQSQTDPNYANGLKGIIRSRHLDELDQLKLCSSKDALSSMLSALGGVPTAPATTEPQAAPAPAPTQDPAPGQEVKEEKKEEAPAAPPSPLVT